MKFTEGKLEHAFTELLGQEGFPHHLGITITRKPDEVLLLLSKLATIGN
jgi:type I restriction enzyme R subunit